MIIHTDISYLNDAIDYYEEVNNCPPYLFMNKETIEKCPCYVDIGIFNSSLKYDGCRVFEDNKLDFYEVELR